MPTGSEIITPQAVPAEPVPAADRPSPIAVAPPPPPEAPSVSSTPPPYDSALPPVLPNFPSPHRRSWLRTTVVIILAAAVGAVLMWGALHFLDREDHEEAEEQETVSVGIMLPKDATVTAECADERGKQYIVPKDIPTGPIYDVYQGKVVAVEYLIGQTELASKSDMYADLKMPKGGTYDHLMLMPTAPHAGLNEAHFHVIAYLISQHDASMIKCDASSGSSDMHM